METSEVGDESRSGSLVGQSDEFECDSTNFLSIDELSESEDFPKDYSNSQTVCTSNPYRENCYNETRVAETRSETYCGGKDKTAQIPALSKSTIDTSHTRGKRGNPTTEMRTKLAKSFQKLKLGGSPYSHKYLQLENNTKVKSVSQGYERYNISSSSVALKLRRCDASVNILNSQGIQPTVASTFQNPDSNVANRLASAKRITVNDLKSRIKLLETDIEKLKQENKTLKLLQHRQDSALKRFEGDNAQLPKLIRNHKDEVRCLHEQIRKNQLQRRNLEEKLRARDKKITALGDEIERLNIYVSNDNLEDRYKLQKSLQLCEMSLKAAEKRINDYMHYVEILEKNHRNQISSEAKKVSILNKQVLEAELEIYRLKTTLHEKDKKLTYVTMHKSGRELCECFDNNISQSQSSQSLKKPKNRHSLENYHRNIHMFETRTAEMENDKFLNRKLPKEMGSRHSMESESGFPTHRSEPSYLRPKNKCRKIEEPLYASYNDTSISARSSGRNEKPKYITPYTRIMGKGNRKDYLLSQNYDDIPMSNNTLDHTVSLNLKKPGKICNSTVNNMEEHAHTVHPNLHGFRGAEGDSNINHMTLNNNETDSKNNNQYHETTGYLAYNNYDHDKSSCETSPRKSLYLESVEEEINLNIKCLVQPSSLSSRRSNVCSSNFLSQENPSESQFSNHNFPQEKAVQYRREYSKIVDQQQQFNDFKRHPCSSRIVLEDTDHHAVPQGNCLEQNLCKYNVSGARISSNSETDDDETPELRRQMTNAMKDIAPKHEMDSFIKNTINNASTTKEEVKKIVHPFFAQSPFNNMEEDEQEKVENAEKQIPYNNRDSENMNTKFEKRKSVFDGRTKQDIMSSNNISKTGENPAENFRPSGNGARRSPVKPIPFFSTPEDSPKRFEESCREQNGDPRRPLNESCTSHEQGTSSRRDLNKPGNRRGAVFSSSFFSIEAIAEMQNKANCNKH